MPERGPHDFNPSAPVLEQFRNCHHCGKQCPAGSWCTCPKSIEVMHGVETDIWLRMHDLGEMCELCVHRFPNTADRMTYLPIADTWTLCCPGCAEWLARQGG